MRISPHTPRLPGWEQLLHRLQRGEPLELPSRQEAAILTLVTDGKGDRRTILGRLVLSLTRLEDIHSAIVIHDTKRSQEVLATTISRKRSQALIELPILQRLINSRRTVQEKITAADPWLNERCRCIFAMSLGEAKTGYRLVLLLRSPFSEERLAYLRLVSRLIGLGLQNQDLAEQIRREAESVASLTRQLSEGMAILDDQFVIKYWNRPMQRLTGWSPAAAVGQSIFSILTPADNGDTLRSALSQLTEQPRENLFRQEIGLLSKSRVQRWVELAGSAIRDHNQQVHQYILLARDVTEHKLLEERKNEFISIATHELRTPITAIKGYLSLMERDASSLSDKHKGYLERATAANNRLIKLAEDLLLSVQVEEDRLRLNLRPINLAVVVSKVVRDLTPKALAKDLLLNYTSPNFVTWVVGDEEKVQQIFENLIDNAIKYTPRGAIDVWFERSRSQDQTFIITHVRDSGIGISSKNYASIFEKFRRTHNTVEIRESGSGLGLFIVKSFVEKLGGKITLSSRIGKGTTFSVRLNSSEELVND